MFGTGETVHSKSGRYRGFSECSWQKLCFYCEICSYWL